MQDSGFKVQFERNVTFFNLDKSAYEKKEIDIAVFNRDRSIKYAIELKFPRSGQHPEQMFMTCKDIRFIEQLTESGFNRSFVIMVADDPLFYTGGTKTGIYRYFRAQAPLHGIITKPTGRKDQTIHLQGTYQIQWQPVAKGTKYAFVEID